MDVGDHEFLQTWQMRTLIGDTDKLRHNLYVTDELRHNLYVLSY